MTSLRAISLLLFALVAWGASGEALASKSPAPDRMTLSGNSVVLGWEPQQVNPAGSLELEWALQRKDLKVLTWSVEVGGFTDLSYGSGAHLTTAVARHWHTWRGVYAGVRAGVGVLSLGPDAMFSDVSPDEVSTWALVARIPVGVEVGWQHPARGWRAGLRAEQVAWAPYVWKLDHRLGIQTSLGAVVSVPLFWKTTSVTP